MLPQDTGAQMQHTTHQTGMLLRTLYTFAGIATLLALLPAPAFAGRIFIDPGHGGTFPGATYGGVKESQLNLAVGLELENLLKQRSHLTAMSRRSDTNVTRSDIRTWSQQGTVWRYATDGTYSVTDDLQARCDLANAWGAEIFVSIHANAAGSSSANGAETYWRDVSATDRILSQRLASYVQQAYVAETGMSNRGVKTANFYVLRWSNMPAILIETGFMTNSSDLTKLKSPAFQKKAALGIAKGIDRFMAEKPFAALYPRFAGVDRYETAARIADSGWKTTGGTVILTSGTEWPDALAGTPLTRPMDAPVLLTQRDSLPSSTRDRISSQSPVRIVVLGGVGAVSDAVVDAAVAATRRASHTVTVERIAGDNRYATAAAIATRLGIPADGRVFVASGESYADALSVAAYAATGPIPILLVEPGRVPEATRQLISANASSIKQFEIIGGEGAVGKEVVKELQDTGRVVRIAGADRYATNLAVIRWFSATGSIDPIIATGTDFADALGAGALAAKSRRPVILVHGPGQVPAVTREFLLNERLRTANPTIAGGSGAVSHSMDWMLQKCLER